MVRGVGSPDVSSRSDGSTQVDLDVRCLSFASKTHLFTDASSLAYGAHVMLTGLKVIFDDHNSADLQLRLDHRHRVDRMFSTE
jgi:hypothetical protein